MLSNKAGTGYTLQFNSFGLPAINSAPFSIAGAAATQVVVTTQPPSVVTAGAGFGLVVSAEDANGNLDPTLHGNVTASRPAAVHSAARRPWRPSPGWRRSQA